LPGYVIRDTHAGGRRITASKSAGLAPISFPAPLAIDGISLLPVAGFDQPPKLR
jgi:hypothetical protein